MFMALYRAIAFFIVLGVIVALAAIACAATVVAVLSAVAYGLASRKQTVRTSLHGLAINAAAGIELVDALRPHRHNQDS